MSIQYGPIVRWPGKLHVTREHSPFKSSFSASLDLLERELRMVGAESPVVQLAIPFNQWRLDGRPYADAKPEHPGVIVTFSKPVRVDGKTVKVPLSFPCDTYYDWHDNVRAVALALEALRKVDRYGVTQNAEQYTGFKALPGPMSSMPTFNADEAAQFIASWSSSNGDRIDAAKIVSDPVTWAKAYQRAAQRLHPDANSGQTRPEWHHLQLAKELLDTIHARH